MGRLKKNIYGTCFLLVVTAGFNVQPACSMDNVFLTGIIKEIDYSRRAIVIDVKSNQCPGPRRFEADDISQLNEGKKGKRITFSLKSPTCEGAKIYKIILPKDEGKNKEGEKDNES